MSGIPRRDGLGDAARKPKGGFSLIELVIVVVILLALAAFLWPTRRSAGPEVRRTQCKNNLKQIALALHNYRDTYGALPPACTVDAHGKRLHSWRALILPYLEKKWLYDKIDFSKAWDDPANAQAFAASVEEYHCPEAKCPPNHTTYLAVVTDNSCLRAARPRDLSEIASTSNTVMVIEVDSNHAVHWMDPSEADEGLVLALTPQNGLPHSEGMQAAFVDGSVRYLSGDLSAAARRAMISIAKDDKEGLDQELQRRN